MGLTKRRPLADAYHFLLTSSWTALYALMLCAYVGSNLVFAVLYYLDGGIENARAGSFLDAYFFSVQTMATIGYGKMTPTTTLTNLLVSFEALFGLVAFALATGLMFAKFSQPRARVLFSELAVVSQRDGVRSLMIRLANERSTGLVEANLRLSLVREETTTEGIEEATGQTVHARHTWSASEVRFDHRFVDILVWLPDGRRAIDYTRFHHVEPVAERHAEPALPVARQL